MSVLSPQKNDDVKVLIMKKHCLSAVWIIAILFTTGCDRSSEFASSAMQDIMGRGEEADRQSIYRIRAPERWIRRDPLPGESLNDTTKALCEFIILEETETVRISIHNFPSTKIEERVPVEAQLARWRRQFETLDVAQSRTMPQAFSGYVGLLFEGNGILKGKPTMVLGWVLQMAPEHYLMLSRSKSPEDEKLYNQMRSDVTIKAVGPKALMNKHKQDIIAFGRSFELILEIPVRS